MPKIKHTNIPKPLFLHLLDRVRQRNISTHSIEQLSAWLHANPEVPRGDWYKRFQEFTVCGEGELVKTFLTPGQYATGTEI